MVLRLHYNLEKLSMGLVVGIIVAGSIGGLVEIAPLFTIDGTADVPEDMRPQTPLELAGREIYLHLPNGVAKSKLTNAYLDTQLGTTSTIRNLRTVLALVELARQG